MATLVRNPNPPQMSAGVEKELRRQFAATWEEAAFSFYQSRRFSLDDSAGASASLRSGPYVPQCDAFGNWEPTQCYAGTGKVAKALLVCR
ncbi:hypothetical protein P7K49_026442 [Saguinus oedipus]|uniref:Thyroglobulin type-1 domain-containing protein n=1 Tax=Saguinus oedipus TaxID=9490 RepID=A0ABQ9UDG3_SAGOE|nr:hypothetical protein P7K49_026442 [Saguinus oedipus]